MQDLSSSTITRFENWTVRFRELSDPNCRLMLMVHGLTGDENSMWVFGRNLSKPVLAGGAARTLSRRVRGVFLAAIV